MDIRFPGRTAVILAELTGVALALDGADIVATPRPGAALRTLLREHKPEVVAQLRLEAAGGLDLTVVAAARQPPQGDLLLAVPGHKG